MMTTMRWTLTLTHPLMAISWAAAVSGAAENAGEGAFCRLVLLPAPRVVASAEAFPGDRFGADHLVDGDMKTEYASNGKGTNTFVEFDFGAPVSIGGFRHQDRNDPATVAASELAFMGADGASMGSARVPHVNSRGGVTFFALPKPVTAQRVRWRVAELGSPHGTVGGAGVEFFAAGARDAQPGGIGIEAGVVQVIDRKGDALVQPLRVTLDYPYAAPVNVVLRVDGQEPRQARLTFGTQVLEFTAPAIEKERPLRIALEHAGRTVAERNATLKPARKTTVYILPHSHTDIGYTEIQTQIEDKQVGNLLLGMKHARETAGNPPGSRFVWNVEVLWAADLFLRRMGPVDREAFFAAVKQGQVALDGMYLNELTGLCRPEELVRLFRFATQLREQTGAAIDSAMISDVPGYTWGTVPAMAQAGIRYFSVAPNYFDRIGDILVQWENKPFWWIGPDGKSKVLVWIPFQGYAMSHRYGKFSPQLVEDFCSGLEQRGYPYDMAYVRWAGHGDNAVPDPAICEFVKEWNAAHAWPRFVISSTSEAFRAFEKAYGERLPQARGDWTPYWEDGAGSSSLETAMNRASSDRLAQAEALWAMGGPGGYPAGEFMDAWNEVLLYSEHTWGAWCSVREPDRRETREQWAIKQSYAVCADRRSRDMLSKAIARRGQGGGDSGIDVCNTTSWPRTEVVTVPKFLSEKRAIVRDAAGGEAPAQTLRNGELVFLATDVPPLAARRFTLDEAGAAPKGAPKAAAADAARATGAVLENGRLRLRLDEATGGIVEMRMSGLDANLADTSGGHALNDYLYLIGDDITNIQRTGPVTISVGERGPLIASLVVESEAPGCFKLTREIRLAAGADFAEIINLVDKRRLEAKSYMDPAGKESVNFAFPFQVPGGEVRLDVPFGVVRPDADQIASACKNWFTVGRWADVANADFGVTWVTLDAPLVQVGGITATMLNSQFNPGVWRKEVGATQKLYSWAMNNHWGTNYRACQEGPVAFRFVLRPHRGPTDPAEAARFATAFSQPLLVAGANGAAQGGESLLRVAPGGVILTGLKPSDDGKAVIVRLFNASGKEQVAELDWGRRRPRSVRLSDTGERAGDPAPERMTIPGFGIVVLRAETN